MDWRLELQQLESAYANVIPEKALIGPSSKITTSLRMTNPLQPPAAAAANSFSFKKWSDQGIRPFPPRVQIQMLPPLSIPYFTQTPNKMPAPADMHVDFVKELEFLESYVVSIYDRAVINRNNAIDLALAIEQGPMYAEEEDEETLDNMSRVGMTYENDRIQLTDEVNSIITRKLVELESTVWNTPNSIISSRLELFRQQSTELRNALMATALLYKSISARLSELKQTPLTAFCPMDGIKPSWVEIDKIRAKQTLSGNSRNFATFMAYKKLPITPSVFQFLQNPSEYANTLTITHYAFEDGELLAVLDFFILSSHPLVLGKSNRNTVARSVASGNSDNLNNAAEKKLLYSLHCLRIMNSTVTDRDCSAIAIRIPMFSNLHTLSLCKNHISSMGAMSIASALWSYPMQIRLLQLDDNEIGIDGALSLSKVIPRCKQLTVLSLSGNPIGDIGLYFIIKGLMNPFRKACGLLPQPSTIASSEYENLEYDDSEDEEEEKDDVDVDVEGLSIGASGSANSISKGSSASSIISSSKDGSTRNKRTNPKMSRGPETIDVDDIDDFSVNDSSVYSAGSHIPRKPPNFRLALLTQTAQEMYGASNYSPWRTHFTNVRMKVLAVSFFMKFRVRGLPVTSLSVARCSLTAEAAAVMRYAFTDNVNVAHIDISGNPSLGDAAADSLSHLILQNQLVTLKMSKCGLTDTGIQILTHAACRCSSLQTLDVSRNYAGPTGISWLAASGSTYTIDDLTLSAGYHHIAMANASTEEGVDEMEAEQWDLWQGAEDVAAEVAEYYGGGFYDADNDYEGEDDEANDDDDDATAEKRQEWL